MKKKLTYQNPEIQEIVLPNTNNLTSTLSAPADIDITHEDIIDDGIWQ